MNDSNKATNWQEQVLNHPIFKLALGALFLFGLLTSIYSALAVSTDLQDHWVNVKALLSGSDIYDSQVNDQVASVAVSQYGLKAYDVYPIYPPSCYAMLTPFALADWTTAKVSWLVLSLLLTFLLVRELSKSFCEGKYLPILLAVLVSSIPWRQHILYGQNAIWSLYFFLLAVRLNRQNKEFLSGIALALALFKYSLVGPMCLYFLFYQRAWKNLLVAFGLHAIVNGFFAFYLHKSFFYLILSPLQWCGHKSGGGAYDFFGLWSLVNGKPGWVPYLFSAAAVIALAFVLAQKKSNDEIGFLALTAMVSTALIYHSMNDYIVILFPIAWTLTRKSWDKGMALICLGVFLIGYLRGHYFHFAWQSSHAYLNGDDGAVSAPQAFKWSFKTLYTGSYSILWFLSIGLLGTRLARSRNETGWQASGRR